jgi:hypothetical protein
MNAPQTEKDILQQAHLHHLRGDHIGAREMLEGLLKHDPDNRHARALLDRIAERSVQAQLDDERKHGWLYTVDLSPKQIERLFVFGGIMIVVAIIAALPVLFYSLNGGLNQTVLGVFRDGKTAHFPLHIFLLFPSIALILGLGAIYYAYSYRRYLADD